MVKYGKEWTSFNNYSFTYGGINMYLKTNLKEKEILISEDDCNIDSLNNTTDDLYLSILFNTVILNSFIDKKIEELSAFYKCNDNFKLKSIFLDDWKTNRKKEVFKDINQVITSGNLKKEKLKRLNKRIDRYFKYFDLIDKEENMNDKYEEMFNTLVQIPSEIYSFIKEENSNQSGEFIKDKYYYDEKIPSSVYMEDGCFCIAI